MDHGLFARETRTGLHWRGDKVFNKQRESWMHATTVALDLAKSVIQIAVADQHWRIAATQRLTRPPLVLVCQLLC